MSVCKAPNVTDDTDIWYMRSEDIKEAEPLVLKNLFFTFYISLYFYFYKVLYT